MKHLDLETAIKLSDEAIAKMGESFVYEDENGNTPSFHSGVACQYIHDKEGDKTPGCIVGHVMVAFGIDPDDIIPHENDSSNNLLEQLGEIGILTYDNTAKSYLRSLQSNQDEGKTWGEARKYARERLG